MTLSGPRELRSADPGPAQSEAIAHYEATALAFVPVLEDQRNASSAVAVIKAFTGRLLGINS